MLAEPYTRASELPKHAAMAEPLTYGEYQARSRRNDFVRRNRWMLALLALIGTATAAWVLWWMRWLGYPTPAAFLAGSALTATFFLIRGLVNDNDGSYYWRMGREAEKLTATALRRLERAGWTIFHNVSFDGRDVDHVAVGRGGILVLETKWSASGRLAVGSDCLDEAQDQALRNMKTIRGLIRSGAKVSVVGAVVAWGLPEALAGGSRRLGDDVLLLNGRQSKEWVRELTEHEHLDDETVAAAIAAIGEYVARRNKTLLAQRQAG